MLKLTLNWLGKVLVMAEDRFPRAALGISVQIYSNDASLATYDCLRSMREVFLEPIGEQGVLDDLETLSDPDRRAELMEKYINFRTAQDLEKCASSSSLLLYQNLASKS